VSPGSIVRAPTEPCAASALAARDGGRGKLAQTLRGPWQAGRGRWGRERSSGRDALIMAEQLHARHAAGGEREVL
jgi:hypothetical protein